MFFRALVLAVIIGMTGTDLEGMDTRYKESRRSVVQSTKKRKTAPVNVLELCKNLEARIDKVEQLLKRIEDLQNPDRVVTRQLAKKRQLLC